MRETSVSITTLADLETWLDTHHTQTESVWLVYFKPSTKKGDVTYSELVDVLLCYGWIDSLPRKVDEERTAIRISPRNPKSNWSRVNKEKIKRLTKLGRLKPAGEKLIQLAKQTGTWDALNDVENLVVPTDLQSALKTSNLQQAWEEQSRTKKRGYLEQLFNAKKIETKQKLIKQIVSQLEM
jgi:uncharacterized protein YdeI (YjbR/CyaY-like superfamily)